MMPPTPQRAGQPPMLDGAAQQAIHAARQRAGLDQPPLQRFPPPSRLLTGQERADAAERGKQDGCQLCGGIHPMPNMPACPRVAEFKCNADGLVIEAKFWPDGDWDSSRVLFLVDAAEPDDGQGEEADGG
jgi:hypothetical protein